jgi:hypothetical protein
MKYLYLVYIKWTPNAMSKGSEFFQKWINEHDKLCKENNVNPLWGGIPYTTVEESAFFYETDMELLDFHQFKNQKIFQIMGGGYIDYGNTHIFLSWPNL